MRPINRQLKTHIRWWSCLVLSVPVRRKIFSYLYEISLLILAHSLYSLKAPSRYGVERGISNWVTGVYGSSYLQHSVRYTTSHISFSCFLNFLTATLLHPLSVPLLLSLSLSLSLTLSLSLSPLFSSLLRIFDLSAYRESRDVSYSYSVICTWPVRLCLASSIYVIAWL